MAKKTFFVADPLRHDGVDYVVGDKITLDTKEAEGLLGAGVLSAEAPAVAEEEAAPVADAESPAE